jgi:hypothetical protein
MVHELGHRLIDGQQLALALAVAVAVAVARYLASERLVRRMLEDRVRLDRVAREALSQGDRIL